MLPEIGQVGPIPVSAIRPFKGQPRTHFDEQALKELADSIAAEGQRTPAWVMPISNNGHQFELIAGERRWRAVQMAGIETLLCEVRNPESAAQQYLDSVMENFGRKDCTILESAMAVKEVFRIKSGGKKQWGDKVAVDVARVFARSTGWVYQMLQVSRLHPRVLDLLRPPQKLPTPAAISLASLSHDMQLELANEIVQKGLKNKASLAYIKNRIIDQPQHLGQKRARPYEDHKTLTRFLASLGGQMEALLLISHDRHVAMFKNRPARDLDIVVKIIAQRRTQLQKLEDALRGIRR